MLHGPLPRASQQAHVDLPQPCTVPPPPGETVFCILIWYTFHFSTRSLEMHFKFAVLSLFHFIYNESLRIIFYEGVARCLE